jgi:hypothetical protein
VKRSYNRICEANGNEDVVNLADSLFDMWAMIEKLHASVPKWNGENMHAWIWVDIGRHEDGSVHSSASN